MFGFIGAAAGALAKSGLIRGTAGKLLGGGTKKATAVLTGPVFNGAAGTIGSALPSTIGKILRSGAGQAATGVAIGATMAAVTRDGRPRRIRKDGKPYKRPSMNPVNPRALRRALSRVERFEKLVKRSFIVKDIKARKRSCR